MLIGECAIGLGSYSMKVCAYAINGSEEASENIVEVHRDCKDPTTQNRHRKESLLTARPDPRGEHAVITVVSI